MGNCRLVCFDSIKSIVLDSRVSMRDLSVWVCLVDLSDEELITKVTIKELTNILNTSRPVVSSSISRLKLCGYLTELAPIAKGVRVFMCSA